MMRMTTKKAVCAILGMFALLSFGVFLSLRETEKNEENHKKSSSISNDNSQLPKNCEADSNDSDSRVHLNSPGHDDCKSDLYDNEDDKHKKPKKSLQKDIFKLSTGDCAKNECNCEKIYNHGVDREKFPICYFEFPKTIQEYQKSDQKISEESIQDYFEQFYHQLTNESKKSSYSKYLLPLFARILPVQN